MVHNLTGGGAERVAALWATGFINKGHQVGVVLNCKEGTRITYSIPKEVKMYNVYSVSYNYTLNWIINLIFKKLHIDFFYLRQMSKVLYDFRPDMVVGVIQPWAEWARKTRKGLDFSIINTEHNSFEKPANAIYLPMTRKLYKQKYIINSRYDHVTVLTDADKKCINGKLTNVTVLPNPLAFTPANNDVILKKQKTILAAGRLNVWHYKGFDLLINAWGKIAYLFPDWKLQIAGYDRNHAQQFLQDLADKVNLGTQIEFIGFQEDMKTIYQNASIFVLSSRYEGFGMVLIEAMSQGCASIACDYRGRAKEIITSEKEGIICPVEDIDALAVAIKKMIEDDAYRLMTQKNAIERSKFYSLNNIMDKWCEIIKKIEK